MLTPIPKDTMEAWAKILEDLAKIAIIAMPALFYGEYTFLFKGINLVLLAFATYYSLVYAKLLRSNKMKFIEEVE